MNPAEAFFTILIHAKNYPVLIEPLLIRITIFISIFLFMLINSSFIYKRLSDKQQKTELISNSLRKEFKVPASILIGVIVAEIFFQYCLKVQNSLIEYVTHFIYEIVLLLIIVILFIEKEIKNEFAQQYKNHALSTLKYHNILQNTKKKIYALNTTDYRLFFDPLGLRYFVSQRIRIEENTDIDAKRIISIRCKKGKDFKQFVENAINETGTLSNAQRKLKNIQMLHNKFFELYLVPEEEIMDLLAENKTLIEINNIIHNQTTDLKTKIKLKEFDNILIDDICYYPHENKNELIFENKQAHKEILIKIFERFANSTSNNYHISYFILSNTKY